MSNKRIDEEGTRVTFPSSVLIPRSLTVKELKEIIARWSCDDKIWDERKVIIQVDEDRFEDIGVAMIDQSDGENELILVATT